MNKITDNKRIHKRNRSFECWAHINKNFNNVWGKMRDFTNYEFFITWVRFMKRRFNTEHNLFV